MTARLQDRFPLLAAAALLGALGALAMAPRARTTMSAEATLALGGRPDWLQASWAAAGEQREPAVQRAVSAAPNDVELQIAAATLPSGSAEEVVTALDQLARRFPGDAAIRAHQLRHLTRQAIGIQRAELEDFSQPGAAPSSMKKTQYPSPAILQQFRAAAAAGSQLEPENGFFPAMQAVGEFAAGQDQEALRCLKSAAAKSVWDDHAMEETRAQARLHRQLYGDGGALQHALNAMSLLLPHFARLRQAARMAVWHADQRQRAGDLRGDWAIRSSVMRLGIRMAEQSPLIVAKSVGVALFEIGMEPVRPKPEPETGKPTPPDVHLRRMQERFTAELEAGGETGEAAWVRSQGGWMEALSRRLQEAVMLLNCQEQTLFPPLTLLGWWAVGVVLLKQIAALAVLWLAAVLLGQGCSPAGGARLTRLGASVALLLVPVSLIGAISGLPQVWNGLDAGTTIRLLAALLALWGAARWWGHRSAGGDTRPSTGLWLALSVLVILTPFMLVGMLGSMPLVWTSLAAGFGLLAVLGLARWSGRWARGEGRPRWQPALVAMVSVLPTTIWLLHARDVLAWDTHSRQQILGFPSPYQENFGGMENTLPLLVLVPLGLLAFFVLCRVVALELPVRAGIARGLRRAAPAAIGLLAAVYLLTLLPTLAEDHRTDRLIQQTLRDEVVAAEGGGSGR